MTDKVISREWLESSAGTFFWGMSIAFSAKLATMSHSASVILAWEILFLFLLPLLMPLRYLVAAILATVVFLDASLWFRQGAFSANTVYESAGAYLKPPELLFAALAAQLLFLRGLPVGLRGPMKLCAAAFAVTCLIGAFTALMYGTPLREVLIFSELRSPLTMVIGMVLLAPLVRLNPPFFIDCLGLFLLAHFCISLLSWAGGVSLLWESYASNYVGSLAAFFGGDESVMVYLLVQGIALGMILAQRPELMTRYSRPFWWLVLCVTSFAIVASLRRAGIMSSAIMVTYAFVFSSLRYKLRLFGLLVLPLPLLALVAAQLGLLDALLARLAGEGSVAVSDLGRQYDLIQAREYVSQYFWFGTGAATKLALWRTQAYGVAESLSIHHGVYHVWVRFGVFGAAAYSMLFFLPLLRAQTARRRITLAPDGLTVLPLVNNMAGLLLALFLWGLNVPAIFINFRQAGVLIIVVCLIYALSCGQPSETNTTQVSARSSTGDTVPASC